MKIEDFDIIKAIDSMKEKRKVFHSEADFQFALSWEIKEIYPEIDVRLEYAYKILGKIYHLDILLIIEDKFIPIELKYKTVKNLLIVNDEEFILRSHSAQDGGKYDFIKDIVRIETLLLDKSKFFEGYTIMITNDSSYWKGNIKLNTCCAEFDIAENKEIKGLLKWAEHTSIGTKKNREDDLNLLGKYKIKWNKYSYFNEKKNANFKYVLVKVSRNNFI